VNRPRFHVIFMPGTTRHMALFPLTLLEWSDDCDFVLVANACTRAETKLLKRLAKRHHRLEYMELPVAQPVAHHAALRQLVALEKRDRFCFLDNDILADGEYLSDLLDAAERHDGVFACPPIWADRKDQVHKAHWRRLGGRYHVTDTGMVVGGTYLAMYAIDPLREVLDAGAPISRSKWEKLPDGIRAELDSIGMHKDAYDTAKVVNLMLVARGYRLVHVDLPHLHHVGGVSVMAHLGAHADLEERRSTKLANVPPDERESIESRLLRRELTAAYVGGLLRHLFDGEAAPAPVASGDDALDGRLTGLADAIRRAFARHAFELGVSPPLNR
jgi:hypothetical protein